MKHSTEKDKSETQLKSLDINSSKIKEDNAGNCIISGRKIEANACSVIKDNYKKR